ncbi:RNA-binding motif protein, X chromosome isoform X3 [Strongylocentrotus purpuratus]|uniref:RRM domain-containing protein n=1 Tax=Strongylocentrotus purpuratus TaxID=7668 RepID=A0A7M7NM33_STRPU|nr:RNA-binding motif protein, X chromosome isoform X3 [Strongylocentrotus purpuratus]
MTHPSKMPAAVKDSPNKIFVSNLPKTWDEGRMEKLFETFGKISQVNLMKNKESGDSRGFGFITFDTAEDANDAIQGMNGKDVEGVQLKVDAALKSLHSGGGGGMGDRGGRGGFRGGRGGFQRGRGGPLMRGGPMGGFPPRGGPRGGFMPRGRGGPYSRGGYGGDRDSGFDGGPPSRGMGRGRYDGPPRGGPPRGGPRGAMRGSPRGAPRGAPRGRGGPGRPLIDRPPMEEMDQDAGYNAPRGSRPLLEPLLQDPGAPEFRQAREPLGHPMERPQEGYRNSQQRRPGMNPDHRQQWSNNGRNGGGYSDGGLLPTRQAQWDSAPVRREQEPLMRDREARAPPPMERLTAERPRSSFPPEREASYGGGRGGGAAASTQYGEESYGGGGARGGAAGRGGGGGREEFGQSRGGGASSYDYQAESRPTRAEYGAAASADPLFRSRDPYGAANSDPAPARQTRDSFMERDYAPPARSADPYGAAPSAAASRGYGAREPALPRDAPLSREAPRGRDPLPSRDYAPPARSQRDYAEPRREETVRDYARGGAGGGGVGGARGGYADERPAASSFASRTFEDYDKASSRGYGAASDSFGAARDPAGSTSSSRSAYASRDPYPSGRGGDRAEKPGYGDPFRSAPQSSSYGGRSAPSDRNGGGGGRPYSRY